MKTVIIVGAGSTLSDGVTRPLKKRPPLDKGFFASCRKLGYDEFAFIEKYLTQNYDLVPSDSENDSLERIMAIIYADINNPNLQTDAIRSFRNLIHLFNRRIAETTNDLNISNRSNLYRIIAKKLKLGTKPDEISIVTFNQDIQIEKTLAKLEETKQYSKRGKIFSFPNCYRFPNATQRLSGPPRKSRRFNLPKGGD